MRFLLSLLVLLSTTTPIYISSLSLFHADHRIHHENVIPSSHIHIQDQPLLDGVIIEPTTLTTFKIDNNIVQESTLLFQQHQEINIQQQQELEQELEIIMGQKQEQQQEQEQKQDLLVSGDHIPTDPDLKKGIKSLTEARKVLRKADDPIDSKSKLVVSNNFLYKVDHIGRPLWARGMIVRKKRSTLSDAAHQIADVMYYHSNKQVPRVGNNYHTGHIIASALGGTDTDPINFFPQHYSSNSRGGVWWRLEMIAGHIKDTLLRYPITSTCQVMITAQLNYQVKQWKWMPTKGYYYIEMNEACSKAYVTITKVSSYSEVGQQLINELMKKKLIKDALSTVIGGKGVNGYRFIYKWENKYDKADPIDDKKLFKSL